MDRAAAWTWRGARWLWAVVLALAAGVAAAPPAPTLEIYVREGCPHCAAAERFVEQLERERPGLQVVRRDVGADADAAEALVALSRSAGIWPPGVPTFVVDGRVLVGFDDAEHSGRAVRDLLDAAAPRDEVETSWFGTLSAARLGLPLFTLALGLLDGVNPCAMWVLLFLLSLLVRLRDRRRMALVAGSFVLASAAVYYAFMAAWLNLFLAVGMTDAVRIALGAVALAIGAFNAKDFVAWGRGPSLGIPAAARPGLVARMMAVLRAPTLPASLLGVALLAVLVNLIELLCTAGLPAVYTAVLARQDLTAAAHHAYLALYIAGYVADDAAMVAVAVAALGSGRLTERAGRWLKLISAVVMLALGAILLWRPGWLL